MPRRKKTETTPETVVEQPKPGRKPKKETVTVQFAGKEYDVDAIRAAVKADIKGKVQGEIKIIDIYIKPEDGAAYYVANDVAGKVEL